MTDDSLQNNAIFRKKGANGLIYGLLAGLAFALTAWGYEGLLLSKAFVDLPWLKLALGGVLCLFIGGVVGRLSVQVNSGAFVLLIWLLVGISLAWISTHISFDGVSLVIGIFQPDLRGLGFYPLVKSALVRMIILYVTIGGLSMIAGALEMSRLDSARRATSQFGRGLALVACVPIYILAGLVVDNLVNQPLREPILEVNNMLRFAQGMESKPATSEGASGMYLRALDPLKGLFDRPRRLTLGDYDAESFDTVSVIIDFDGVWASCSVINGQLTYCQRSKEIYTFKLSCLLSGRSTQDCRIQVLPTARSQFASMASRVGATPNVAVLANRGTVVLLAVQGEDQSLFRCRLRVAGEMTLEACESDPNGSFPVQPVISTVEEPTQTPNAAVILKPTATATLEPVSPVTPLLAAAQATLPDLSTAPVYSITLTLDYAHLTFQAQQAVKYINAEDVPLERLYFRLFPNGKASYGNGALKVSQVSLDGQLVQTQLSLSDSALEVKLPRTLKPGEGALLDLNFTGTIPVDYGGEATPAAYGIYNFTQNVLALSGWYPVLAVYDDEGWNLDPVSEIGDSVYSDMAFYSVDVAIPADLMLAATGVVVDRQVVGETAHYRFAGGPARDFFMIMSPKLSKVSRVVSGTTVNSYYLSGNNSGGEAALDIAAHAVADFNMLFGLYPYSEFDVVDAPMRNALGVEYPGIVLIGDSLYGDPQNPNFILTVAHEVAHQWWYNIVGNDVLDEPWLDEALTTYTSGLFYEVEYGKAGIEGVISSWQQRYESLIQQGKDDLVTGDLAHFESLNDSRVYGGIVYRKGALFFVALRQEIGDEAFFKALKNYYRTYQYRIATGNDLLNAFEEAAGRQLDDFYYKWLYSIK